MNTTYLVAALAAKTDASGGDPLAGVWSYLQNNVAKGIALGCGLIALGMILAATKNKISKSLGILTNVIIAALVMGIGGVFLAVSTGLVDSMHLG